MGIYTAMYKCRLCGETHSKCATGNKNKAMACTVGAALDTKVDEPLAPTLISFHFCENGSFGISDFQGFELKPD